MAMARTLLSSGSSFETDIGYSRAVTDGDWIFVSGTTGFDYATMTIPDDVVAQCKQSMRNIASVLSQASASMPDIVRVGASSNLATEQVVRAPPDGYTLIQLNVANAINASLYSKLSFDVLRDLAPVASFMRVPNVMEISPTLPVKTVPEFIAYAKANPGKVLFASSGVGTTIHMSGELFKTMAAIDIVHVPYRGLGAGGYADLMTGTVHVTFDNLPPSLELIRAGKLRALAVTSTTRSQAMPELPTVADFLPGYEASAWYGIAAPAGTPPNIVTTLNRELNAAFADPKMQTRIAELGGTPLPGSPADFARLFADETDKWAKVVKLSGAKPE